MHFICCSCFYDFFSSNCHLCFQKQGCVEKPEKISKQLGIVRIVNFCEK